MNKRDENTMLTDILNEAAPPDWREAAFEKTLHAARWRKRNCRLRAGALAAACAGLGALLLAPGKPTQRTAVSEAPGLIVHTIATAPAEIVQTHAARLNIAPSKPFAGVVHTIAARSLIAAIDDNQLLAMLPESSAVLVYSEPGHPEVVFLTPKTDDVAAQP